MVIEHYICQLRFEAAHCRAYAARVSGQVLKFRISLAVLSAYICLQNICHCRDRTSKTLDLEFPALVADDSSLSVIHVRMCTCFDDPCVNMRRSLKSKFSISALTVYTLI